MSKQSKPDVVVYSAWYSRGSGHFTLQRTVNGKLEVLFKQLPARSGQAGCPVEWIPRKSPIPFGTWRLNLDSIKAGRDEHYDGIGEFFPISSGDNQRILQGGLPGQVRYDVGLHWENQFPGSWGCVVLVDSTPEEIAQIRALFKTLRELYDPDGLKYIPLHVVG
ncbi:MAG TPA: hypothetical protein VN081_03870 [Dongiaceae bacterium]|nr:hypothetical protein [Dongiaceae bacterium]